MTLKKKGAIQKTFRRYNQRGSELDVKKEERKYKDDI